MAGIIGVVRHVGRPIGCPVLVDIEATDIHVVQEKREAPDKEGPNETPAAVHRDRGNQRDDGGAGKSAAVDLKVPALLPKGLLCARAGHPPSSPGARKGYALAMAITRKV